MKLNTNNRNNANLAIPLILLSSVSNWAILSVVSNDLLQHFKYDKLSILEWFLVFAVFHIIKFTLNHDIASLYKLTKFDGDVEKLTGLVFGKLLAMIILLVLYYSITAYIW